MFTLPRDLFNLLSPKFLILLYNSNQKAKISRSFESFERIYLCNFEKCFEIVKTSSRQRSKYFHPILRNHSIELETRWSNLKNKRNIFLRDSSPQARRIHERSRVMRIEDRTALLFHAGESERGQSRSLFCVHPRRKAWMEHESSLWVFFYQNISDITVRCIPRRGARERRNGGRWNSTTTDYCQRIFPLYHFHAINKYILFRIPISRNGIHGVRLKVVALRVVAPSFRSFETGKYPYIICRIDLKLRRYKNCQRAAYY